MSEQVKAIHEKYLTELDRVNGCAPVSTPHTPPVAEQASRQAGIDSPEFRDLLRIWDSVVPGLDDEEEVTRRLIAHIDAKLTEARRDAEPNGELAQLRAQNMLLVGLYDAVAKLVKAKGRFHTEQNYGALVAAYDLVRTADRAAPASNTQEDA